MTDATDLRAVRWIHGAPDCEGSTDPPLQVVALDEDTFVIRQSKCVNFEAPFLVLLLGVERALLHDTGATADADHFPIRRTVDELIEGRGSALTVTHSHGHGDHHAGDVQFADLPSGSVAPIGVADVADFFGIEGWPSAVAMLDLGDRPIDVLPAPGHLDDHVVLFDRTRGLLLSGDRAGSPSGTGARSARAYAVSRASRAKRRPAVSRSARSSAGISRWIRQEICTSWGRSTSRTRRRSRSASTICSRSKSPWRTPATLPGGSPSTGSWSSR